MPTQHETIQDPHPAMAEDIYTCGTCLHKFDREEHIPKSLICTHSFCLSCVKGMMMFKKRFSCPTCKKRMACRAPERFPDNAYILQFIVRPATIPVPQALPAEVKTEEPVTDLWCLTCDCSCAKDCMELKHSIIKGTAEASCIKEQLVLARKNLKAARQNCTRIQQHLEAKQVVVERQLHAAKDLSSQLDLLRKKAESYPGVQDARTAFLQAKDLARQSEKELTATKRLGEKVGIAEATKISSETVGEKVSDEPKKGHTSAPTPEEKSRTAGIREKDLRSGIGSSASRSTDSKEETQHRSRSTAPSPLNRPASSSLERNADKSRKRDHSPSPARTRDTRSTRSRPSLSKNGDSCKPDEKQKVDSHLSCSTYSPCIAVLLRATEMPVVTETPRDDVLCMSFRPVGSLLASVMDSGLVAICHGDSPTTPLSQWRTEGIGKVFAPKSSGFGWSADGSYLAVGSDDNRGLVVWKYPSFGILNSKCVMKILGHPSTRVIELRWNLVVPHLLLTHCHDKTATIVDMAKQKAIHTLRTIASRILCFEWIAADSFASVSLHSEISLYRVGCDTPYKTLAPHNSESRVNGMLWNEQLDCLIGCYSDGNIKVWSPHGEEPMHQIRMRDDVLCIDWDFAACKSETGDDDHQVRSLVACVLENGAVSVWDTASNYQKNLQEKQGTVIDPCIAFSPDGKFLCTVATNKSCTKVKIWITETWEILYDNPLKDKLVGKAFAAWDPNSKIVAINSRSGKGLLAVYEINPSAP